MKRSINTFVMILIATAGLTACSTSNTYDQTPYESRTAGEGELVTETEVRQRMMEAEKSVRKECSRWKNRAMEAEERIDRLQQRLQQCYRK